MPRRVALAKIRTADAAYPRGRVLAELLVMAICVLLTFCISATTFAATVAKYTIAIATFMSHPALDTIQTELKAELATEGFVEGQNTTYIVQNANGQIQLAASIANNLTAQNPDAIVAVTTPMAQAVAKIAKSRIVFAAVTDPVGAGLVSSLDRGDARITGTSDAWPYEDQLKLIREITPNIKILGVLFNPGEAASQYGIRQIRKYANDYGFSLIEVPVNSTADVFPNARSLVGRAHALFLSSDNTVIAGVPGALQVARQNHLPVYVGDSGTVKSGGLATVSVGYAALGRKTGELVARTLRGERNIPTVVMGGSEIYVNKRAAELMGVTIPESVLRRATSIFQAIE